MSMGILLIDIAYLIECTQDLFCAIEYDCDTPLHYEEYKSLWNDYGFEIKAEDSKMIDEGAKIIQGLIEDMQNKIDRYDRIMQWLYEWD